MTGRTGAGRTCFRTKLKTVAPLEIFTSELGFDQKMTTIYYKTTENVDLSTFQVEINRPISERQVKT